MKKIMSRDNEFDEGYYNSIQKSNMTNFCNNKNQILQEMGLGINFGAIYSNPIYIDIHDEDLLNNAILRKELTSKVEVLEKVKKLILLPDDMYATSNMVSDYYEVDSETIKKVIQRNINELCNNGLILLTGDELRDYKNKMNNYEQLMGIYPSIGKNAKSLFLFNRSVILNIAMLLKDSIIANKIKFELGMFPYPRKEIRFKELLLKLKEDIYNKFNNKIENLEEILTIIPQYYDKESNRYLDFYFPNIKLIIEYDERYHETPSQKELDDIRTCEIANLGDIIRVKYGQENLGIIDISHYIINYLNLKYDKLVKLNDQIDGLYDKLDKLIDIIMYQHKELEKYKTLVTIPITVLMDRLECDLSDFYYSGYIDKEECKTLSEILKEKIDF